MYPDLSATGGASAGSSEKGFVKGGMAATKGGSAGMTVAAMPMAMPVATAVPMVQGVDSKLNYEAEVARAAWREIVRSSCLIWTMKPQKNLRLRRGGLRRRLPGLRRAFFDIIG